MRLKFKHIYILLMLVIGNTYAHLGISQAKESTLQPIGFAIYSEFSVEKFVTGLFLTSTDSTEAQANRIGFERRLELRFITDMSQRSFLQLIQQNSAINSPRETLTKNATALEQFNQQFKGNFVQGDHLIFDAAVSGKMTTSLNGITLSSIPNKDLFTIIINAWIGTVPPSRETKDALLGFIDSTNSLSLIHI